MISAAPANKANALVADPGSISGLGAACAKAITAVVAIINIIPIIFRMFLP